MSLSDNRLRTALRCLQVAMLTAVEMAALALLPGMWSVSQADPGLRITAGYAPMQKQNPTAAPTPDASEIEAMLLTNWQYTDSPTYTKIRR